MSLYRRNGNIFNALTSGSIIPRLSASYDVTAFEIGAVVNGAQTGSTITVRAGHGFAANDLAMVGLDTTKYFKVGSITATTLSLHSGSVTVSDKDQILNLGLDTGSTSPNYDGSQVSIYDEPSGVATAISSSRVTCDSEGGYGYWYSVAQHWELVRDGDNDPVEIIPDITSIIATSTTVTSVTVDTTLSSADRIVLADASDASLTITLPTSVSGRVYDVKKTDSSSNTVTVDADGTETIDDGLTAVITSQYEAISIVGDGSNWSILA